jgi:phage/plasmid-like protein (TIGR03299 family)
MSAGLEDSDTMFSVRETPWHGLGAVLDESPATVAEAIEASGLHWRVAKEPIAIDRGEVPSGDWWQPRCEEIPGFFATVRQDTREVLGIVGERYRIVQNHEAFAFIDQLLGSSIHFETAGSLHGGRRVWVLATLPDHVEVGGDDVRPYVLLMNSHDGSTAVVAATTPVRVVCQNTLNWVCAVPSRSSRSATPKRSRSACMRRGGCSISRSTTTRSSSASATSSPPSAAPSASFARSSTSSTRTARATR